VAAFSVFLEGGTGQAIEVELGFESAFIEIRLRSSADNFALAAIGLVLL
jgi:hypothetical protein